MSWVGLTSCSRKRAGTASFVRDEILLPLQHNDGTPVEPEMFEQTRSELVERFRALIIEPQSLRGVWLHEGTRYEDELVRLVVDVPDTPAVRRYFVAYKQTLMERFQQLDTWITASPIRIV